VILIFVRLIYKLFFDLILSSISHVVLLAPFCVFIVVSIPVLRTDSLSIARRS
jgi:hypothetical protein